MEKFNPKVAVIIPIFNVEKYLEECLDSVIKQSYQNLSIVLVDDGSTDRSSQIAQDYFERDGRIVLIRQKNGGSSRARNVGLDYLEGKFEDVEFEEGFSIQSHLSPPPKVDFVHFLDSDDYLTLDCIESCVEVAQDSKIDVVWHRYFQQNELVEEKTLVEEIDCFVLNLQTNQSYPPVKIFRARKTKHFSWVWCGLIRFEKLKDLRFIEGIEYEDVSFGMMLFASCQEVYLLDQCLMYYRIRPNSICQYSVKGKMLKPEYAPYMQELVDVFGTFQEAKVYSFYYADCVNALEVEKFIHYSVNHPALAIELRKLLAYRCLAYVFNQHYKFVKCDPKNCNVICEDLTRLGYKPTLLQLLSFRMFQLLRSRDHFLLIKIFCYCPVILLQTFSPTSYLFVRKALKRLLRK